MKLQYINRITLFNKVVRKSKVKANHVYFLFIIYKFQPINWHQAFLKLRNIKRVYNEQYYNDKIKELINLNLIARDSNRLYSLTDAGLSTLKDIENRLRKERHDK